MAQPPGPLPVSEKPLTPLAMESAERMEKYTEDELPPVTFTEEEEKALLRRFDWILLPIMVRLICVQDEHWLPLSLHLTLHATLLSQCFTWALAYYDKVGLVHRLDLVRRRLLTCLCRLLWDKLFCSTCVKIWTFSRPVHDTPM